MVQFIKDHIKMESQMAMGNTYGKTDKFIKANGWTA
jgi:hypothetical protein